ncbi:uncharacterized protein Dana_GF26446, isoform B [Drosophila ananassae]|uniref:Uncharacterized protein, isoform A n=1 Tax=Drosophila ananassae TaxID=7217 RepID=A0A0P8YIU3_DROAN|nr:uncharacterized protein LOC26513855 [Drosophila ananassae]XP_014765541.1 uncharacterized protein LOC26513855 [Drosophila ananassae]KPU78908.1 uncharacterized protein Dana_GF26446, isoform A [Drosophila ananassae]KPU78909.1 uncharacterized protein Dana_GF26446, isoform B [Drosophila ananassae]
MPLANKLVRNKCCCCISLTSGCIIVSFYTLFFGFLNAGILVDDVLYRESGKTDPWSKWFNICHVGLNILAALILLLSIVTKYVNFVFVWMAMFILHMIAYYVAFHAMINVRMPFFNSAITGSIYVICMCLTLGIDFFCLYTVYCYYFVTTHPDDFRPRCVDK